MGRYTSAGDLRKTFKKIDTSGLIDTDLDFYITMSEAEIDGRLAPVYTLPFSSTPPLLRSIAAEYSFLKVMDRFQTGMKDKSTDWITKRRKNLMNLLQDLVSGDATLVTSGGEIINQRADIGGIQISTGLYVETFGHGNEVNEEVDPDRIEDEQDARDV